MYLEVYPDIVFILNFFIDFLLLFLLKKVNRKASNCLRMIFAAAIGALFAALICIFPWVNRIIQFLLLNFAASYLMLRVAFGRLHRLDMLKQIISLYLITYFLGGFINSIYYYTDFRIYLIKIGKVLSLSNLSVKFIFAILLPIILVSLFIIGQIRNHQSVDRKTYEVELVIDQKRISVNGLVDTGNCLYDPVFKKPVIVVEHSVIGRLLSKEFLDDLERVQSYLKNMDCDQKDWNIAEDHLLRIRYIPYKSIGKTQGMMLGLVMDQVLIHKGKETICNEKVTVAICHNQLSTKEEYHAILHQQLL